MPKPVSSGRKDGTSIWGSDQCLQDIETGIDWTGTNWQMVFSRTRMVELLCRIGLDALQKGLVQAPRPAGLRLVESQDESLA